MAKNYDDNYENGESRDIEQELIELQKESTINSISPFAESGNSLHEFFLIEEINLKNVGYPPTIGGGWARPTFGFLYSKVHEDDLIIGEDIKADEEPKSRKEMENKMNAVLKHEEDPGRFIYTDKKRGFSISFPEQWIVRPSGENEEWIRQVAGATKGGNSGEEYNFPFLFIFFKDFIGGYKKDGRMGANISIGKVKLITNSPRKDFDLQRAELPNSIPGYQEISHEFDDDKRIGRVEMESTIGDMEFRMVQHYHYQDNGDPIVITYPPHSERQEIPSEELNMIIDSFEFINWPFSKGRL